jgi:hypothetical protein
MENFVRLLALVTGTAFLGVSLAFGAMFVAARNAARHDSYEQDYAEGRLGMVLTLFGLGIAAAFFYLAIHPW